MSETYERLAAPFDRTHKKQGLDYITGEQAVSRLNDVLGYDGWSFKVLEHGYHEEADEFWALGELTLNGGPVVQQFGSQKPNRFRESGKIIDLGFDLKGAATDALKKCASLRGVGLYLHEKDAPGATQQAGSRTVGTQPPPPERPAVGETTRSSGGRTDGRPAATPPASSKGTLKEITAQMGFGWDDVINTCQVSFENRMPRDLNKAEVQKLLLILEEKKKEPVGVGS